MWYVFPEAVRQLQLQGEIGQTFYPNSNYEWQSRENHAQTRLAFGREASRVCVSTGVTVDKISPFSLSAVQCEPGPSWPCSCLCPFAAAALSLLLKENYWKASEEAQAAVTWAVSLHSLLSMATSLGLRKMPPFRPFGLSLQSGRLESCRSRAVSCRLHQHLTQHLEQHFNISGLR